MPVRETLSAKALTNQIKEPQMGTIYKVFITALVMCGAAAFAGTGYEQDDKRAELDRILKERQIENLRYRLRVAAVKAGLNPREYNFAMSQDGRPYFYNKVRVCVLVAGKDASGQKDVPANDTISCQ